MIEFLYTALTIIGSGGVLILVIETFRDWLFKRLEEYMELAKHKINTISKNIPSGEKCVESRLGVDSDGGTGLEASVILYIQYVVLQG